MILSVDKFKIQILKKTEKLEEQILIPTSIRNGKPAEFKWQNKIREFFAFDVLALPRGKKYQFIIGDIFDFIDLIEILKAFSNNKLDSEKEYNLNKFSAKISRKENKYYLRIDFKSYKQKSFFYDKFEAATLAAKFQKILSRCEVWGE